MNITIRETTNRGNNLLAVGFLAVTGVGMIAVMFRENEFVDKLDDIGILLAAIGSVIWYQWGKNRYKRSFVPLALVALAFAFQIAGFFFESDDRAAVGDNVGLAIPLLLIIILAGINLYRTRVTANLEMPESEPTQSQA